MKRSDLPNESDWEKVRSFEFAVEELLSFPDFLQIFSKTNVVARTVMGETFNPFNDQGRQCIYYVTKELLKDPSFKFYLVIGLACFGYNVWFLLPKS